MTPIVWALLAIDIAAFVLPLLLGWGVEHWSKEKGLVTLASVLNLFAIGWVCLSIYRLRHGGHWPRFASFSARRADPAFIWCLMGIGFIFLGFDDAIQIHEKIDGAVHALLGIKSNNYTDRLDDILIAAYGGIGLLLMVRYRAELLPYWRYLKWLSPGFALMLLMVLTDLATNRDDFLPWLVGPQAAPDWKTVLGEIEEITKVAGSLLLAMVYAAIRRDMQRTSL